MSLFVGSGIGSAPFSPLGVTSDPVGAVVGLLWIAKARKREDLVATDLGNRNLLPGSDRSGTTHFHAYTAAAVVHKGHRCTLAWMQVEQDEKMKVVVQGLLAIIRQRNAKIRFLLLDKGFFGIEVISYLKRAGVGFIIPALVRGTQTETWLESHRPACDP